MFVASPGDAQLYCAHIEHPARKQAMLSKPGFERAQFL